MGNGATSIMQGLVPVLQILIPISMGLTITTYLGGVTKRLLIDLCGSVDRAEFWVRITAIALVGAPLVFVLLWGSAPQACRWHEMDCYGEHLHEVIKDSVIGILVAVFLMSWVIWKRVPGPLAAIPAIQLQLPPQQAAVTTPPQAGGNETNDGSGGGR